ncbi:MAG: peptidoglycan-binding domain-containing protein [Candidatus Paceibacterota bacterium]
MTEAVKKNPEETRGKSGYRVVGLASFFALLVAGSLLLGAFRADIHQADAQETNLSLLQQLQTQIILLQQQIAELQGAEGSAGGREVVLITTDLAPGDRLPQVRTLQQALNSVPSIQVAATGAGSPGNESEYFGSLTTRAVIAFQERYASEILAPWNLSRGTGYVGRTTRRKLNELTGALTNSTISQTTAGSESAPSSVSTSPTDESPTPSETGSEPENTAPPTITHINPPRGANGHSLVIHGTGFSTKTNTIMVSHTQPEKYQEIASPDGETLTFTLNTFFGTELEKEFRKLPAHGLAKVKERFPEEFPMYIKVRNDNGDSNILEFNYRSFANI